jgi:hypothetical protein
VIVSINKDKSTCQVVVKNGLIHHANDFHALGAVPKATNDWVTNDLEDVFNNWKGLPKITEQDAACFVSSVGGQGMVKCNCKGDACPTAAHAKKLVGYAALAVTGTANAARTTMTRKRYCICVRN